MMWYLPAELQPHSFGQAWHHRSQYVWQFCKLFFVARRIVYRGQISFCLIVVQRESNALYLERNIGMIVNLMKSIHQSADHLFLPCLTSRWLCYHDSLLDLRPFEASCFLVWTTAVCLPDRYLFMLRSIGSSSALVDGILILKLR